MLYSPESTRRIPLLLHQAAIAVDYRPFAEFQLKRNLALADGIALACTIRAPCLFTAHE